MPNWYLNSMGWIVSFLRYAALRLFWTLRGPGWHNVTKKYRGGLNAHSALNAHTSPRAAAPTQPSPSAKRKLASPRSTLDGHDERGNMTAWPQTLQAFFPLARLWPSNPDQNQSNGQHAQRRNARNFEHLHETKDLAASQRAPSGKRDGGEGRYEEIDNTKCFKGNSG